MSTATKMIEDLKQMSLGDEYAPKPKRDPILTNREATHGPFAETARIAQELKTVMVQSQGFSKLNHAQREALDLIATKIGRILAGDPTCEDHWGDIAGYAKLGVEACV